MKQITQTVIDAGWGNCYTACICSIFELDLSHMPVLPSREEIQRRADTKEPSDRNFEDERRNAWHKMWNDWFEANNLQRVAFDVNLFSSYSRRNLGCYHIINGPSPRDPEQNKGGYGYDGMLHSVVGRKGLIIWDPHPSRVGLLAIDSYELIVPTDPARPILEGYRATEAARC
ncbi:MAG: hypothetical protein ACRD3E_09350 [Terriglobales bacterium]